MPWELVIGLCALVVAAAALVVALVVYVQARDAQRREGEPARSYGTGLAARGADDGAPAPADRGTGRGGQDGGQHDGHGAGQGAAQGAGTAGGTGGGRRRGRGGTSGTTADGDRPDPDAPTASGVRIAFVANPSKAGAAELRPELLAAVAQAALPEPLWFETTVEDPGRGQARAALDQGATLVVAVGGDGTVRAVAETLAGTGVPMGILPRGTGNLLARNLDIPTGSVDDALAIVLAGHDRRIDVGRMRVDEFAEEPAEGSEGARGVDHVFLVISGLGFDAAMVADADDTLKKKVGWVAYFLAGVRHLHARRTAVEISLDGGPTVTTQVRSLMVGNCGELPGGITLIPDAVIDDGRLDVVAIDTRAGIVGWAQLFGEVVMQGFGVSNDLPAKVGRIDSHVARRVTVTVHDDDGEHVQVDGDLLGRARRVTAWVELGALVVRSA